MISMYTNIPTDLVIKSIERRWNLIENKTLISIHEFLKAITIIINFTFFKFEKKIFKQIFGMLMGSPLSPILANIVLQDLEQEILTTNNIVVSFFVMSMTLYCLCIKIICKVEDITFYNVLAQDERKR